MSCRRVDLVDDRIVGNPGTLQGAGGVGGLLYLTIDGAIYVPLYDNNGNVTHYCDAAGAVVAQYTYDAFGRTISQSGPMADAFRHRFSTKCLDPETGLYYYGYRFYHSALKRWLNRDPIEEDGGLNLYGFCGNDGVGKGDVFGLVPTGALLWRQYVKYSYSAMETEDVWKTVGGSLKRFLWNDESKVPPNACATRLSMSLAQIPGEHIPNGDRQFVNTLKKSESGIPGNYITSAQKMLSYLKLAWGTSGVCSENAALYFVPTAKAYETDKLRNEIEKRLVCCGMASSGYVAVVVSVTSGGSVSGHVAVITESYNDDHTPYTNESSVWILPPTKR